MPPSPHLPITSSDMEFPSFFQRRAKFRAGLKNNSRENSSRGERKISAALPSRVLSRPLTKGMHLTNRQLLRTVQTFIDHRNNVKIKCSKLAENIFIRLINIFVISHFATFSPLTENSWTAAAANLDRRLPQSS